MRIRNAACIFALLLAISASTGCITSHSAPDSAALPPTEVRAMQTRSYELQDPKSMLKVVLDVLQDDGFMVDYAHTEMGILHATKTITATDDLLFNRTDNFFAGAAGQRQFGGTARVDATVNVTVSASGAKVRIGLQRQTTSIGGYSYYFGPTVLTQAGPIVDAKIYQEFFAKLDRGIFLQKQGL
ncbi:MAG: hypothetical protein ACXWBP_03715 [Limisphaerales bacterium]